MLQDEVASNRKQGVRGQRDLLASARYIQAMKARRGLASNIDGKSPVEEACWQMPERERDGERERERKRERPFGSSRNPNEQHSARRDTPTGATAPFTPCKRTQRERKRE